MRRKWNTPLARPDIEHAQVDGDTLVEGVTWVLCDDDIEMIRQGYKCIECLEVCPDGGEPFPAECWLCGFHMRDHQSRRFDEMFKGWTHVGSTIDWDAEEERLEKQRWERGLAEGLRSKGVVLPKSV